MIVIYASNMSIVQAAEEWTSIISKREQRFRHLIAVTLRSFCENALLVDKCQMGQSHYGLLLPFLVDKF
jgi:hypothetical protein